MPPDYFLSPTTKQPTHPSQAPPPPLNVTVDKKVVCYHATTVYIYIYTYVFTKHTLYNKYKVGTMHFFFFCEANSTDNFVNTSVRPSVTTVIALTERILLFGVLLLFPSLSMLKKLEKKFQMSFLMSLTSRDVKKFYPQNLHT